VLKASATFNRYAVRDKPLHRSTAMPTLNAFLILKYNGTKSDFGEDDGYFVGLEIVKFLKDAIAGVRAFDNADYWWSGTRGSVGQRDLVCNLSPLVRGHHV
jgi:hypothetical protein